MITKEELNKVLAEYAGFKLAYLTPNDKYSWYWIRPDRTKQGLRELLPAFVHSLDLCFKWLVPNKGSVSFNDKTVCILTIPNPKEQYGSTDYWSRGTPPLALCRAIKKWIDAKEKFANVTGTKGNKTS